MDKEIRQLIFTASQRKLTEEEYVKLLRSFDEELSFSNLRKVIEWVDYGEVRILVQAGKPRIAEKVEKQIKLDKEVINLCINK
ncbi:MAG: hypothetical protein MNSN_01670 [Minisyncoccus archaeiphilus]|uniref:hypothetical protein n=1 Tax=Minisyncoccus archaeiphilus TaxID=3238481 RepID=UPI002B0F01AD|nr:MAG: hypothetical protein MNSN_01670 [Candidatus Parcubacteria bacterium]